MQKYSEVKKTFGDFKKIDCDDLNNKILGYSGLIESLEYYLYLYSKVKESDLAAYLVYYFQLRECEEDEYNFYNRLFNTNNFYNELNEIANEYKEQIDIFDKNQKDYYQIAKLLHISTNPNEWISNGDFTLTSFGDFDLGNNNLTSIEFGYKNNKWYFTQGFFREYNLLDTESLKKYQKENNIIINDRILKVIDFINNINKKIGV